MVTNTSAGPSFLGYIYQMEYALFLLLKAERDETEIGVEYMDDVDFTAPGSAVELFQLKHHINHQATLTDYSPDLWKSIGNWSRSLQSGSITSDNILTLVTTAVASKNSICASLKPSPGRDNKNISDLLFKIADRSSNENLKWAFDAYQGLSNHQRETLVSSIRLLDGEPDVISVTDKIKPLLQVRFQYRDPLYARLHHWWFERVKQHVIDGSTRRITKEELIDQIADLNAQFRPQALPIDFRGINPPEPPDPLTDQRMFVSQLKQIMIGNREIELAIVDYYRAFEQRSRWEREQLLHLNELEGYEQHLLEEWERVTLRIQRQKPESLKNEDGLQSLGREVFDLCHELDIRIRDEVTEPYVRRGSFHMLANEELPRVWWHPQFIDRLQELLPIPESFIAQGPPEIANLFNAAFGARILRSSIKAYQDEANRGMPFALTFLVLPIVLHKPLRQSLPRGVSTKMHVWLRENQQAYIKFSSIARNLVPVTKEGLMFGMYHEVIDFGEDADFSSTLKPFQKRPVTVIDTEEVKEIERRAQFVGKWFARAGSASSIFMMWGVRP